MEKSITNISGSSSGTSSYRGKIRVCGILKKFWCVAGIEERISNTKSNPSRGFYRCSFAAAKLLRNDPHVFKWMDDAMEEEDNRQCSEVRAFKDKSEIEFLEFRLGVLERVVRELKSGGMEICDKMKMDIFDTLEEGMTETKRSMKKLMVIVFSGRFVLVVLGLLVKDKV